jgi:phenylacetate-CoA ligase
VSDHYDAVECRDPAQRAREEAAALPAIIARAMSAPGWARHLAGIDAKSAAPRLT